MNDVPSASRRDRRDGWELIPAVDLEHCREDVKILQSRLRGPRNVQHQVGRLAPIHAGDFQADGGIHILNDLFSPFLSLDHLQCFLPEWFFISPESSLRPS